MGCCPDRSASFGEFAPPRKAEIAEGSTVNDAQRRFWSIIRQTGPEGLLKRGCGSRLGT